MIVGAEDECWEWLGTKNADGYGNFYDRSLTPPTHRAHRIAYGLLVHPVPGGMDIDHLCRNPGCVNPAHMEIVTRRENTLRGTSPIAQQARQTHCRYGHVFDEENTRYRKDGSRQCRKCDARHSREKRQRRKASA